MGKIDETFKAKWIEALRSGKYKQGKGCLKNGDKYCCLGVAAIVAGYKIRKRDEIARPGETGPLVRGSYDALDDFGIVNRMPLIVMNDGDTPFTKIADYIEKNL